MPGKIVATYLARVTVREREGELAPPEGDKSPPPTIAEIEHLINEAVDGWDDFLTSNTTAERTDI